MPKVTDEHRAARRGEIIEAALRAFARNGYARTSMADVIAESGLSAGAIYGYFSGKQDLLRAAAERVLGERGRALREAAEGQAPRPSEVIRSFFTAVSKEVPPKILVQLWAEATMDPSIRSTVHEVFERLRGTIREALEMWGAQNPGRVPDSADWSARVALAIASFGPGFILFSAMLDDFDQDAYFDGIDLALGIDPRS
ncbi:TetR/AcrR family transcriptional regulator [Microbacterium gorillae]|uniref:TetR/AcrR family transcriptional regulator n=1 Tax=Microbacterium gorillae TaxID=1231063 RepID=UPI00058EAEF9|nr:TetR/AcrR family transcriptional regulator [Microbacterium gorillae]